MGSSIDLVLNSKTSVHLVPEGEKVGKLTLLPVQDGQHHGYLEIQKIRNNSHIDILDKISLDALQLSNTDGLTIEGKLTSRRLLNITITQKKRNIMEKNIIISPPYLLWALSAGVILLTISLGLGFLFNKDSDAIVQTNQEKQIEGFIEGPEEVHHLLLQEEPTESIPEQVSEPAPETSPKSPSEKANVNEPQSAPIDSPEEVPVPTPDPDGVLFLPNSPLLTDLAKDKLDNISITLSVGTITLKLIRGHCALYGTEQGRMILSKERAEAVTKYLKERGAKLAEDAEIVGVGAAMPLTTDRNSQEINRRVEIYYYYE